MKIYSVLDKSTGSRLLSDMILEQIKVKRNSILGLITGSSPVETYQLLVEDYQNNQTDWSQIKTFNLDEYIGIDYQNQNSYHHFMNQNLFNHINIKKENIFIPETVGNLEKNINNYQFLLKNNPIDLQILGIGENGHIGFNEPQSDIESGVRIVTLSLSTLSANQKFFKDVDQVPKKAITMGIKDILNAKKIILVAYGKNKKEAVSNLINNKDDPNWPCTYLQNHENLIVIADQDALA